MVFYLAFCSLRCNKWSANVRQLRVPSDMPAWITYLSILLCNCQFLFSFIVLYASLSAHISILYKAYSEFLISAATYVAWHWNDISNALKTSNPQHIPFQAKAIATMGDRAISSQVKVPFIFLNIHF
jgi:hypothetical protein